MFERSFVKEYCNIYNIRRKRRELRERKKTVAFFVEGFFIGHCIKKTRRVTTLNDPFIYFCFFYLNFYPKNKKRIFIFCLVCFDKI